MPFGSRIKAKRLEIGLTGPELSRLSGVNQPIISKLENGQEVPEKNLWLLVEALKIPFNTKLFSKTVRAKRESLGWSIATTAKVIKISGSVIYLLESNKKIPSMALCYKLAKTLKLNLEDFIDNISY